MQVSASPGNVPTGEQLFVRFGEYLAKHGLPVNQGTIVETTAANMHDSQVLPELLHGQEMRVRGDAAHSTGNATSSGGVRPTPRVFPDHSASASALTEEERACNRTKSMVRAKVEHAFMVIKRIFGWANVRYWGLVKNTHWLQISGGLANLDVARRRLLAGV